jgi:hypothetical protein
MSRIFARSGRALPCSSVGFWLPADLARLLKARPRTPALRILRHYYDRDGHALQVSLGYYPEGRFSYNTRMRVNLS